MTRLSKPEQWVLSTMTEMEVAEMIEQHVEHYAVDAKGNQYPVHYPTPFVKHYMNRDDGVLPTVVAIATAPIVMPDGGLLAPDGFDHDRGIQFIIPDDLRAIIPKRADCTKEAVAKAMKDLCDKWLVDVACDMTGKCIIIADALTIIERSLLDQRPCFFITAGRRGGGKTTVLNMLIMAVTGNMPSSAAWSTNEEERRKALLAFFMSGASYILWDNIARGTQISCPHIERSCTSKFYADRRLGLSETVYTAASTIHLFNGNAIGPKGDLVSRSLTVNLEIDRVDPENREFAHPNPVDWTEDHRAEIMQAFYTILLGNPQLTEKRNAAGKSRFKTWWRLVGSAVEHAAGLCEHKLDFMKLFLAQEVDDEESSSLFDVLDILKKNIKVEPFTASDAAEAINDRRRHEDVKTVRDFLLPGVMDEHVFTAQSVTRMLKKHVGNVVGGGNRMLALRRYLDPHTEVWCFHIVETVGVAEVAEVATA